MKISLSCFVIFLFCGLAAADLQTAEQLLAFGEFEQCKRVLDELLKTKKLPEEQMAGVLAMKEYLLGADPAGIAQTVKQAKQTAAHSGWLTADRLKHAAVLIRRAEEWKRRGIPECPAFSTPPPGGSIPRRASGGRRSANPNGQRSVSPASPSGRFRRDRRRADTLSSQALRPSVPLVIFLFSTIHQALVYTARIRRRPTVVPQFANRLPPGRKRER